MCRVFRRAGALEFLDPRVSVCSAAQRKRYALVFGVVTHLTFALAVVFMAVNLSTGFEWTVGRLHGSARWIANTLLLLQFPMLHSLLLTSKGRKLLSLGRSRLATTRFVLLSALDLFLTFLLWSPEDRPPPVPTTIIPWFLFAASWIFLVKAINDAGAALQLGYLGWLAEYRDTKPLYPDLPQGGLYRYTRNPIYLGFLLVILTAPVLGSDALHVLFVWGSYCLIGPIFKERRLRRFYRDRYLHYARRVPYMLPKLHRR